MTCHNMCPYRMFKMMITPKMHHYLETRMLLLLVGGCIVQSVGHLTRKSGVLGSIPGLATFFRFSFRFFKKSSCQILEKVCARSTG